MKKLYISVCAFHFVAFGITLLLTSSGRPEALGTTWLAIRSALRYDFDYAQGPSPVAPVFLPTVVTISPRPFGADAKNFHAICHKMKCTLLNYPNDSKI